MSRKWRNWYQIDEEIKGVDSIDKVIIIIMFVYYIADIPRN